jgi:hypothetical protein
MWAAGVLASDGAGRQKVKDPSTKIQAPDKHQTSNTKLQPADTDSGLLTAWFGA